MTIVQAKLAEAWAVRTLAEGVINKTVVQAMENINVPENLRQAVEIIVANRIIETLPNTL